MWIEERERIDERRERQIYIYICEGKILRGIWEEYTFHEQKICTQSGGHRGLHPEPMPNTNIHENFIKIKFFNFKSNFDQATQKN